MANDRVTVEPGFMYFIVEHAVFRVRLGRRERPQGPREQVRAGLAFERGFVTAEGALLPAPEGAVARLPEYRLWPERARLLTTSLSAIRTNRTLRALGRGWSSTSYSERRELLSGWLTGGDLADLFAIPDVIQTKHAWSRLPQDPAERNAVLAARYAELCAQIDRQLDDDDDDACADGMDAAAAAELLRASPNHAPGVGIATLAVRQPYAEMILSGKRRSVLRPFDTATRGLVALLAAPIGSLRDEDTSNLPEHLPVDAVVGAVELRATRPTDVSRGEPPGLFVWELSAPRRLAVPYPAQSQGHPLFSTAIPSDSAANAQEEDR
jgi:hypothetical protein